MHVFCKFHMHACLLASFNGFNSLKPIIFYFYLFICFTAQVLKVCTAPGPTACSKTKMVHLDKVCLKSW